MAVVEPAVGVRLAPRGKLLIGIAGLLVLAVVFVAGLAWAKWIPYGQKVGKLSSTHSWAGGALFTDSGNQARCLRSPAPGTSAGSTSRKCGEASWSRS